MPETAVCATTSVGTIYDPYNTYGETDASKLPRLIVEDGGQTLVNHPIRFKMQKPLGPDGKERDQTGDAANNMRYAHSLNLPQLRMSLLPRMGRAIIVGGAPSIADHLDHIKRLASDPDNRIFALNWSHTWLLNKGIVPFGCVLFEIDSEPETVLKAAHPDVTYFICSHCSPRTFDELKHCKRVLWHSPPNSPGEAVVADEIFKDGLHLGGGVGTFLRTVSVAMALGYRNFDVFGCDSSFPDDATSTHVDGYETANVVDHDAFYIYAKHSDPDEPPVRFKTVGYLALQIEEFKAYCQANHGMFAMRVHGNSLLRYIHSMTYPSQYPEFVRPASALKKYQVIRGEDGEVKEIVPAS